MSSSYFPILLLQFLFSLVTGQGSITSQPSPSTTSLVSLTPEMSASSVASVFSALATSGSQQPGNGPVAGDAGSSASTGDTDAGARGADRGSIAISRGGIIAIIVVAVFICVLGTVSAVFFYLAKKRSWRLRESIRRSARRVATALTPRRSTFPRDVRGSNRGLTKIDEFPSPEPSNTSDVEKANPKLSSFAIAEPPKQSKWARKFGR
ncbi:hypothetical protein PZA11_000373 [Diplocarpon coronariae]|uniref:Uncharacterized protein n=1 Tax=Diplocarpon coronariae TaxID=2795749 RepID=A0A218Z0A0_9HELO|nr:hypothetical protein JHW43_002531 [Diplocarpon mali]OWP00725.1 hypothetical protein B2J93_1328 [Marssonina coronariae]